MSIDTRTFKEMNDDLNRELCEDEGCPHHGKPHICIPKVLSKPDMRLQELSDLFAVRNKMYGDSYLLFGPVIEAMFPTGLVLKTAHDWNRFALLFMCAVKLHRYAMKFHDGGQADSLDDLSVYSQMLAYVDEKGGE